MFSLLHLDRIQAEFKRSHDLLQSIHQNLRESAQTWRLALEACDFFQTASHFLDVMVSSEHAKQHDIWLGWIESRMRQLVMRVDALPNVTCRPWPKAFAEPSDTWRQQVTAHLGAILPVHVTSLVVQYTTPPLCHHYFIALQFDTHKVMNEHENGAVSPTRPLIFLFGLCVDRRTSNMTRSKRPSST